MAADIKIYVDDNCTKELIQDSTNNSVLVLTPSSGVNGYAGDRCTTKLYLKNIGNRAALNVTVYNKYDSSNFIRMSLAQNKNKTNSSLYVGDMQVGEIIPIYITVQVPRGTEYNVYMTPLVLDYYSLPTIDNVFYNPYAKDKSSVNSKYRVVVREIPISANMFSPRFSLFIDGNRYVLDADNTLVTHSTSGV